MTDGARNLARLAALVAARSAAAAARAERERDRLGGTVRSAAAARTSEGITGAGFALAEAGREAALLRARGAEAMAAAKAGAEGRRAARDAARAEVLRALSARPG
ncbi:hypothetical protein BCF33_2074 [Hasllibacter halocynthiae]|uniref:Uncharacterized protein n=1 Tax=Hasllibacter halocynthiae TaxID=595589 RepID=A0A2T0X2S2_9RHOB|nr:hypothetical protein [Hasllibacter halocynthiae]PRY93207.1 hypothetical protein BCF33_2074 [Hasllibacter halocynthiae]